MDTANPVVDAVPLDRIGFPRKGILAVPSQVHIGSAKSLRLARQREQRPRKRHITEAVQTPKEIVVCCEVGHIHIVRQRISDDPRGLGTDFRRVAQELILSRVQSCFQIGIVVEQGEQASPQKWKTGLSRSQE